MDVALLCCQATRLRKGSQRPLEIAQAELSDASHLKAMRKYPFKPESLCLLYLSVGDLSRLAITR